MTMKAIVTAALDLVPDEGRAVLGIVGVPGAGKTTLAEAIVAGVTAVPVSYTHLTLPTSDLV